MIECDCNNAWLSDYENFMGVNCPDEEESRPCTPKVIRDDYTFNFARGSAAKALVYWLFGALGYNVFSVLSLVPISFPLATKEALMPSTTTQLIKTMKAHTNALVLVLATLKLLFHTQF